MNQAPLVILIGEEHLPGKLKAWERVHGRMLDWVAAALNAFGCKASDRALCPGIEIEADLLAKLHEASGGSARRICVNLDRIRELARTQGLDRVGKAEWGQRTFFQGLPPHARRGGAGEIRKNHPDASRFIWLPSARSHAGAMRSGRRSAINVTLPTAR